MKQLFVLLAQTYLRKKEQRTKLFQHTKGMIISKVINLQGYSEGTLLDDTYSAAKGKFFDHFLFSVRNTCSLRYMKKDVRKQHHSSFFCYAPLEKCFETALEASKTYAKEEKDLKLSRKFKVTLMVWVNTHWEFPMSQKLFTRFSTAPPFHKSGG